MTNRAFIIVLFITFLTFYFNVVLMWKILTPKIHFLNVDLQVIINFRQLFIQESSTELAQLSYRAGIQAANIKFYKRDEAR